MGLRSSLDRAALAARGLALLAVERIETGVVFNPTRAAWHADPYPSYRELRRIDPFHRCRAADGWILTRYADILSVLGDRAFSADERNYSRYARIRRVAASEGLPDPYESERASMLRMDPPDHTRLRSLVNKAFTPRAVDALRGRIEEVVEEVVEALPASGPLGGSFELIRDFAAPLPITVIAEMLGVPTRDRERFRHWSDESVKTLGDNSWEDRRRALRAMQELGEYIGGIADLRRVDPRDDLISGLVAVEEAGDRLSREELFTTCVLLLVAGNETTTKLIGNAVVALLRNPDQLSLLREEPKRIPGAVDELLRYDSPVQLTSRFVLEEGEMHGQRLRRGQQLVLLLGAGNRDPEVFERADELDVTREGVHHLSFGHGVHHCLGSKLARLEGALALEALVTRFPRLRFDGEIEWGRNTVLRGPTRLPLRV
jgi:cytochrome P450